MVQKDSSGREIILQEANPMYGVFQNIVPPSPHRPALWCGGGHTRCAGWRGGGGSIFWKTPDTALYSTYVSTLWVYPIPYALSLLKRSHRTSCTVTTWGGTIFYCEKLINDPINPITCPTLCANDLGMQYEVVDICYTQRWFLCS